MNEAELQRNERSTHTSMFRTTNPHLPFGDAEFDGCGICVSIDYLTRRASGRARSRARSERSVLLRLLPSRIAVFPTKAIAFWHQLDDRRSARLIERYLREGQRDTSGVPQPGPQPCAALFLDPLHAGDRQKRRRPYWRGGRLALGLICFFVLKGGRLSWPLDVSARRVRVDPTISAGYF